MARLEDRIRAICRAIMATGAERGEVEFVHDLAALLPSQVFGELMGHPAERTGPRSTGGPRSRPAGRTPR